MSNFSNIQKNFILNSLKKNLRIDGRDHKSSRELNITFGKNPGEVEISLGNTIVIGRVKAKIVSPHKYRDREGYLKFNIDLTAMRQNQQKSG
jgi:exosome complex component RRP45